MSKTKTHKMILEFDNKNSAANFVANWLDGGGDGGGNLDWNTKKWNKTNTRMRVSGTGYAVIDGVIQTPEVEEENYQKAMLKYKGANNEVANTSDKRQTGKRQNKRNKRTN